MAAKRILLCADWHCGHRVGLTPPDWQICVPKSGDRRQRKQADQRAVCWSWFAKEIEMFRPFDGAVLVGDAIDGTQERLGGIEATTTDQNEQVDMAYDVAKFIDCPRWWVVAGTPYHGGQQSSWELSLARKLGAPYEAEADLNIAGLHVLCKHYIGNTSSPASRFTQLSNAQVKQALWSLRDQQPLANVIVRAHIHRCQYSGIPADNWLGMTLPGLQGLGTRFGAVQCDGLPIDVGFVVLDVEGLNEWSVSYRIMPMSLQKAAVHEV